MKVTIFYENSLLKSDKTSDVFRRVQSPSDLLDEVVVPSSNDDDTSLVRDGIVIYVYENVVRSGSIYKIHVNEDSVVFQTQNNFIETRRAFLEETLCDLLVLLLGFTRVNLKGIVVRDSRNVKIRPEIELFVNVMPYFSLYGNLFFNKEIKVAKDEGIVDENSLPSQSDSPILHSLLKSQNLYFTDIRGKTYVLFISDEKMYIRRREKIEIEGGILNYIYGFTVKDELSKFLDKYSFKFIQDLKSSFLTDKIDVEVSSRFNSVIKILKETRDKRKISFIGELITFLPYYTDHRNNFYNKLVKLYNEVGGCNRYEEDTNSKFSPSGCEYLKSKQMRILERIPIGSLKKIITKKE
jgi:hypothetical protein